MKRKKNINTNQNFKKRKNSDNNNIYNNNSGDKRIENFFTLKSKEAATNSLRSKSKLVEEEIEKIEIKPSKTYNLIQNPSKHLISGDFQSQSILDYKNRILFNEDFTENLKTILEPFLEANKDKLFEQNKTGEDIIDKETYDDFIQNNLENILIKFLLQIDDKFLFVPKSFMNKAEKPDKAKLKLIEGFTDTKYLCLQYHPTSLKEIPNDNLSCAITNYLKHFNKKIRKTGNNFNRKALVIHDSEYVEKIKIVESICYELDYKIIRIDELEPQKNAHLNKISEATQSMRLSCLSERLSDKLKILERIVSNDQTKFNFLWKNNMNQEQNDSVQSSLATAATKNSDTIPHYFSPDTKERTVYNNIQDNIYQICAKKKTLILIVDSFSNSEDDKTYLNGIINKIAQTKCPIVILTNNFNFAKSDNLFNNSIKTISNHFSFYMNDNFYKKSQNRLIFLTNIVMFLHFVVKEKFSKLLSNDEITNGNNVEISSVIVDQLNGIFNEELKKSLEDEDIFSRISDLSVKISLLFEFEYEDIFYFLNNTDRFSKNADALEKTNLLYEQISNQENKLEVSQNDNGSTEFKKYFEELEEKSFDDCLSTKLSRKSTQRYNKFKFHIKGANTKILKNSTLTKKEQESAINKNNDQLINFEDFITQSGMKTYSVYNREHSFPTNSIKSFHSLLTTKLNKLLNEDKLFFKMNLINKTANVNKRNVFEYNYLLKQINEYDYEKFLNLFGIRKPRSTRKNLKDELSEDNRHNGFTKIFTKSFNMPLLDRYFNCHSISSVFSFINKELYHNQIDCNYFSGYKIYEELKSNEVANNKESSYDGYSSYDSIDEYFSSYSLKTDKKYN